MPLAELCGGNDRNLVTGELTAGIRYDALVLEARAAASGAVADACRTADLVHEDGIHTDIVYPYSKRTSHTTLSLHAQYSSLRSPLLFGVGAGRWLSTDAPFFAASAGVKRGARFSVVAELQGRVTRLRHDTVTREWLDLRSVRELATQKEHRWHATYAVRLRAQFNLH